MGGEKRGISRTLLDEADEIVRIDYGRAFQGSLSTAAATAIFAFEILRNNR
jgi:tRNA G18 (ribose-2'-O)-methylase SpoU